MGPTASGKTALAIELVQRGGVQIVSVDSAQVYKGMDIGTGKPNAETLAIAPHRLISFKDPSEIYSAADFCRDARVEIAEILKQGDMPLLVGGTMLYFKTLRDGMAKLPSADPAARAAIEELARNEGWQAVHRELAAVDPKAAQRIHPNDPQRLQRALEVYRVTGKTLSQFHLEEKNQIDSDNELPFNLHHFAIQPSDRRVLHTTIQHRFQHMLKLGLVDEVQALYQRGDLHVEMPSIKSVGYRQVWQYLAGELDYDGMVERGIVATRQLAKRQLTWLRSWDNLHSLADTSAKSVDSVLNFAESIAI
jgi:tRNA dimethylallyltransferase